MDGGAAPLVTTKAVKTLSDRNFWVMVLLVFVQVVFVAMVYGPIAAFLVELFPTRIRYTSMSLPYHIGNGIFGGLTPLIATSLYVASKTGRSLCGTILSYRRGGNLFRCRNDLPEQQEEGGCNALMALGC
jgi:hypothetical protein